MIIEQRTFEEEKEYQKQLIQNHATCHYPSDEERAKQYQEFLDSNPVFAAEARRRFGGDNLRRSKKCHAADFM